DSDIQADLVHGWIAGYLDQGRQYVLLPPFDEEPLRVPAPEKVGVLERLDQLLRRGAGKGERCLLPLRPSFSVVNDPINAGMLFVAEVRLIGSSLTRLEADRRRVVLHNVVVPIDDPDVAVRADLRHDWGGPLVIAGHQVERVVR